MKKEKENVENPRQDILDFIENNSSKDDLIHWLLNNTEITIPKDDEWSDIKEKILNEKKVSLSALRDYSISLKKEEETADALESIKEEAEKAEEAVEKLSFAGYFGKLSIAIGGIILFLGLFNIAITILLFIKPDLLTFINETTLNIALGVFLGLGGTIEMIGGLLLMTK